MKNLIKIISCFLLSGVLLTSCGSDEKVIDEVFDGVINGAVLRTVNVNYNEFTFPLTPEARISLLLEEQDAQDGDLFEKMEVYNMYFNKESGTTTASVLVETIDAAAFEEGPFGLPRYTLEYSQPELMAVHGLDENDIGGGDVFTTDLVLYLTDGRVYDVNNAGGIITGGFFASPFRYVTNVICPIGADDYTGDYLIEQVTPSIFGYDTFDPDGGGVVVTLYSAETGVDGNGDGVTVQPGEVESLSSTQRAFDADYLAALGFGNTRTFIIDFVCNDVLFVDGQTTGVQCSAGITIGGATNPGNYTFGDDSVFELNITDDETGDCGSALQVSLLLTKQ